MDILKTIIWVILLSVLAYVGKTIYEYSKIESPFSPGEKTNTIKSIDPKDNIDEIKPYPKKIF